MAGGGRNKGILVLIFCDFALIWGIFGNIWQYHQRCGYVSYNVVQFSQQRITRPKMLVVLSLRQFQPVTGNLGSA